MLKRLWLSFVNLMKNCLYAALCLMVFDWPGVKDFFVQKMFRRVDVE